MPGSGMGSRLVIGQGSGLDGLDPFPALMHDDVAPHIIFPMHQHHGVEIITYALGGALRHEDSLGNAATVVAGGAERNLFGRGYSHSEAPVGGDHYLGLQLFILLAPQDRMREPSFQLLAPEDVPEVTEDGALIRVVAGEHGGSRSPLALCNPTLYLDVQLQPGTKRPLPVPVEYQGIVYVLEGAGEFGNAGRCGRRPPAPGAGRRSGAARRRRPVQRRAPAVCAHLGRAHDQLIGDRPGPAKLLMNSTCWPVCACHCCRKAGKMASFITGPRMLNP